MNRHEKSASENFQQAVRADERPDLRSVHVREDVARTGRCGNVHLATGRTCILPERHHGSCEFVRPDDAGSLAQ
jgi:hypothetical protein